MHPYSKYDFSSCVWDEGMRMIERAREWEPREMCGHLWITNINVSPYERYVRLSQNQWLHSSLFFFSFIIFFAFVCYSHCLQGINVLEIKRFIASRKTSSNIRQKRRCVCSGRTICEWVMVIRKRTRILRLNIHTCLYLKSLTITFL